MNEYQKKGTSGLPVLRLNLTVCSHVLFLVCASFLSAGEGYECTVTVDDEDSKVIIVDNWKQVSE